MKMAQSASSADAVTSPLDNVFNLLSGLPQGHEKALKQALYNALALFFLAICSIAGIALFYVLEPFIKPLIWALLCGSVLHPFKYSLSTAMQRWMGALSNTSTPLIFGIIFAPIKTIDYFSEIIGTVTLKYLNYFVGFFTCSSLLFLMYYYTPTSFVCLSLRIGYYASRTVSFVIGIVNQYVLITGILGYVLLVTVWWKPEVKWHFNMMSYGVWLFIFSYISNFAGAYRVTAFFGVLMLLLLGLVNQVLRIQSSAQSSGDEISFVAAAKLALSSNVISEKREVDPDHDGTAEKEKTSKLQQVERDKTIKECNEDTSEDLRDVASEIYDTSGQEPQELAVENRSRHLKMLPLQTEHHAEQKTTEEKSPVTSETYLYFLGWACSALIIWRYVSFFLAVIPPLLIIYIVKWLGHYFCLWDVVYNNINSACNTFSVWCSLRMTALFPVPVIGLYKMFLAVNQKTMEGVKSLIDTASSVAVILALIVISCCTSVFLAVQVYAEGINLVQIMGNALNNVLLKNSQLSELLPKEWEEQMDTLVDNAYVYGREAISKLVKSWLKDVDPQKEEKLESQFLELWDRIYQAWMSSGAESSFVGPTVPSGAISLSWDTLVDSVNKAPELFNVGALFSFAKENVETLLTLLESIWTILKGNVTLAFDSFTALFAVLFGGGTAVINFIVDLIVFFTALFYLLSSSGKQYKPVDVIRSFSPNRGSRFAVALEDAVASVFKASFKMALFHGLWTWLIHNLFDVTVIYIPTVIATMLGAVPFLGTYWASLPAILDLWLNQARPISAVMMLVCELFVTSMVDTAIYQEITGTGHPYLTGLSVAGGIFLMGVEGAIIGPILLCGVFLAINMSSALMNEASQSDTHIPEQICKVTDMEQISHKRSKTH